jgi:AcrR family transcriptional regulator
MESWWRDGTDAVSFNEVVRQAGASKPAVYREFGSEDGLMDAALEYYADNYLSGLLGMTEQDAPFTDVLDSMIEAIIGPSGDLPRGCLLAKMRVLSSHLGPSTQARVEALRNDSRATYQRWVARARAAGEIRDNIPVETAAAFLDSQITALLMQTALGEDAETLRAQAKLTFAGLLPTN